LERTADFLDRIGWQVFVDKLRPINGQRPGTGIEETPAIAKSLGQARPSPVLRSPHKVRPSWILFDVSQNIEVVGFGKHLRIMEPILIHVSASHRRCAPPPTPCVYGRQTMKEARHVAIVFDPEDEMPMVTHDAVRKNLHRALAFCPDD